MRIDKNEVLAGQSILKVRELMKRGSWYPWNESLVVEVFKVNSPDANEFLQALLEQGYIESFLESRGEIKYINTIKGNALGMASAAKPMSRKNAEKKLDDFLERVREVNSSPDYCYHINKVLLFGSMLSGEKEVNDIDLAVELVNGKDFDRRSKARVNIAT